MKNNAMDETGVKTGAEDMLRRAMDILAAEDGRTLDERKKEAVRCLKSGAHAALAEMLVECAAEDLTGMQIQRAFWEDGELIRVDGEVALRKVVPDDREGFLGLQRAYSPLRSMLEDAACRNMVWNEHAGNRALMFSIVRNGQYIGYCGIKNTACDPWEIAIEIQREWTGRGIGPMAIAAMLRTIKTRLGVAAYRVRIEPENGASQRMFEKLGAVPNGLSEWRVFSQEAQCEDTQLHPLDGQIRRAAERFGVEPCELQGRILEYRLSWHDMQ